MITSLPIGIDLGSSASRMAWLGLDEAEWGAPPHGQSNRSIPTTVGYHFQSAEVVVGFNPASTEGLVDVFDCLPRLMSATMEWSLGSKAVGPDAILTPLLLHLRELADAEFKRGGGTSAYRAERVVIASSMLSLQSAIVVRDAARQAGLEVLEIYPACMAAALAFGREHAITDGVALVFSLGAGGFEAGLVRFVHGELLSLSRTGDSFLGGIEFDRRVAAHLVERLKEAGYDISSGVETESDALRLAAICRAAERAKIALSDHESVLIQFPADLVDRSERALPSDLSLDRKTFEGLVADLVDHSVELSRQALEHGLDKSGLSMDALKHVILCGEMGQVPLVRSKLNSLLTAKGLKLPLSPTGPNDVARGAALRAAAHGFGLRDDSERTELWFSTSAVVRQDTLDLVGRVEPRRRDLPESCSLYISDSQNQFLEEIEVGPNGVFACELDADEVSDYVRVEVLDGQGLPIAAVERPVLSATDAGHSVPRGMTTPILPTDIAATWNQGDDQQVLLVAGTPLPARAEFPDVGAARTIQLESEMRKLGTVPIEGIGSLELSLDCDARLKVSVRASKGPKGSEVTITPPELERAPTAEDVSEVTALGPHADDGRWERVHADLVEAISFGDVPKALQRMADLKRLAAKGLDVGTLIPSAKQAPEEPSQAIVRQLGSTQDGAK